MMEPSKDVIELLDNLSRYMAEEGFVLYEQQREGVWGPTDVALSELYQDWVNELARRLEEER